MPLSVVIARYFAYAFAAVATAWLVAFAALSGAIGAGHVYEASWGPANAREVAKSLAGRGDIGPGDVPTAYDYLVIDEGGTVRATDVGAAREGRAAEVAAEALAEEPGSVLVEGGGGGLTFASFRLEGGGACVLVSEYLPQWVSRDLAESLPNPQNLMLAAGAAGSALALALVARRASRVIGRKMAPLTEAAARVGRQDLDFSVARTNVREVNEVLGAMDAMRASLAESLEARWRSERSQREQVASLAHDLKTPLTVLRANADFVAEELADGAELDGPARAELADAARDIAGGVERLDGYVRLLIEASRGSGAPTVTPVRPGELCARVVAEAGPVARAGGVELEASVEASAQTAPETPLDGDAVARAVANLVTNAVEHARSTVGVTCRVAGESLVVEVTDDGPGFSPAALAHGCERLFTDDSSRSARDGGSHYGIGLHAASETARAHGGSLRLDNREAGGARATISLPLSRGPALARKRESAATGRRP